MKRDMDLIRKILFHLESLNTSADHLELRIDGQEQDVVDHHCFLIYEAGLAGGCALKRPAGNFSLPRARLSHLSWSGHEFINTVRDDTLWKKVTEKVKTGVGSASMEIIKQLASQVSKQILGL